MPIGRIFGDVSVFDLLGNFVPGVILTAAVLLLLPSDRAVQLTASPLAAAFVLGIVSFAVGHLVQSYAAQAVGQRETFRNSIFFHQSLGESPVLDFEEHPTVHPRLYWVYARLHPEEPDTRFTARSSRGNGSTEEADTSSELPIPKSKTLFGRLLHIPARFYRSMVEAVLMVRIKRDRPLSNLTLSAKVWNVCRNKYELSSDYNEYGDLLHQMSSDIEAHSGGSRALRFQALRNFQRGMWITCYFSLVLFSLVTVARAFPGRVSAALGLLGVAPWTPLVVELWSPLWLVCLGYAFFMYLFWELKEDFEEEFVEYLMTDFLTVNAESDDQVGAGEDRRFDSLPSRGYH